MVEAADVLLATDRNYLLGSWVASARAKATNEAEASLYEHNARELITGMYAPSFLLPSSFLPSFFTYLLTYLLTVLACFAYLLSVVPG